MKIQPRTVIDYGSIGVPFAICVVADMLHHGLLECTVTFHNDDVDDGDSETFIFLSERPGYNVFVRPLNSRPRTFVSFEVSSMNGVRSITDVYVAASGDIKP